MATYTVIILASTEGSPTDLELSDVCLQLAECLDSPVTERVDGSYGKADFDFESWTMELYEETGDRVWLYTLNASDPRLEELPVDGEDLDDEALVTGLRRAWWRRLLEKVIHR